MMLSLLEQPIIARPPNLVRVAAPDQIKLSQLMRYRFPTRTPQTMDAELAQIAACVARKIPRLRVQPRRDDVLNVVGYGPTLRDTWKQISGPTISMSGSHDFLIERGIIPTWHAQTDGRDHQVKFLDHPHQDVTYLMASICPPGVWDRLDGHRVEYWHNAHGQHVVDWIAEHDQGSILIAGGSTIGMSSIHLGGLLGFRKFRLFGIDGHRVGTSRHAGVHHDPHPQRSITRVADGRTWQTSPQMSNSCDELLPWMEDPAIEVEVVGDSLQAALVREWRTSCAFWAKTFEPFTHAWVDAVREIQAVAESRRATAKFNTGSIPEAAGVALRAITERFRPKTIVEVGTFIGASAESMEAERIYTCDNSNDCYPESLRVRTHPYQTSTQMLGPIVGQHVKADLFFFDGRIQWPDIPLILRASHPETVYVFDDYVGAEKGVVNVDRLRPFLKDHALITPVGMVRDTMTLALLVPRVRL